MEESDVLENLHHNIINITTDNVSKKLIETVTKTI